MTVVGHRNLKTGEKTIEPSWGMNLLEKNTNEYSWKCSRKRLFFLHMRV